MMTLYGFGKLGTFVCAAGMVLSAQTAQAAFIFSDNFDSEPSGTALNYTSFLNWDVTGGSVDLIGHGGYGISCASLSGKCVDMDGTTNVGGTLTSKTAFNFTPGDYLLSFDISGNQRNGNMDILDVRLPSLLSGSTYSLLGGDLFDTYSIGFTVAATTSANIVLANRGGDNVGVILDNVALQRLDTQAPEPATLALLATGLAGIGAFRRRRRA